MNCYYHPEQPAIGYCSECGKSLCKACVDRYGTNLCCDCVNAYGAKLKADKRKLLIRTGVIFGTVLILCLASGYFPFYVALVLAYALAGLPCGWHALSAIQPRMFLFLPIIGWVIYFVIKFFLSYCVGLVAMPVQVVKAFKAARTADHVATL